MNKEIERCVERFKWFFPKSFVYKENELIAEPKNNIYFRVDNIQDELGFKCKVIEYLSRPSHKGISKWYQSRIRNGMNGYLGTEFDIDELNKIYTVLGNSVNRAKTIKFIESGYDIGVL